MNSRGMSPTQLMTWWPCFASIPLSDDLQQMASTVDEDPVQKFAALEKC